MKSEFKFANHYLRNTIFFLFITFILNYYYAYICHEYNRDVKHLDKYK